MLLSLQVKYLKWLLSNWNRVHTKITDDYTKIDLFYNGQKQSLTRQDIALIKLPSVTLQQVLL